MENISYKDVFFSQYRDYVMDNQVMIIFCDVINAITILVGLTGNTLICICVLKSKHLRTHMNVNLVSSGAANIVGCCCWLPVRIILQTGYPAFEDMDTLCKLGTFFRTLCDTLQFFMLTLVSFERYQAIVNPFKKDGRRSRAFVSVIGSWSLAIMLSTFSVIYFTDSTLYLPCFLLKTNFIWGEQEKYLLLPLGLTLMAAMIITYILILRTLFNHSLTMESYKNRSKRKIEPSHTVVKNKENEENKKLSYLMTPSLSHRSKENDKNLRQKSVLDIKENTQKSLKTESKNAGSELLDKKKSIDMPNKSEQEKTADMAGESIDSNNVPTSIVHETEKNNVINDKVYESEEKSTIQVVSIDGSVRMAKTNDKNITGDICVMNKKNREQGKRRVEIRASKKIAALIGSFACCWFPLPVYVIGLGNVSTLSNTRFQVLLLLGTLGSTVIAIIPIIYSLVNRSLNSALKNMIDVRKWKVFKKTS